MVINEIQLEAYEGNETEVLHEILDSYGKDIIYQIHPTEKEYISLYIIKFQSLDIAYDFIYAIHRAS
jgi:hypothetical protein